MWISNFLINCLQQVGLKGSTSRKFSVSSGVPQGLVYVNDIPKREGCSISMFADDTKIYTNIQEIADSYRLQADLNSLAKWACNWLLKFDANKCKHMALHTSHFLQCS